MALSLSDCLREARSIPNFNGTSEYSILNYLQDVLAVISLTAEQHLPIVQTILSNKIQGKALNVISSLVNPTFEEKLHRLKQEFGIKYTYLSLRNEAMNVSAFTINELHHKLNQILFKMNSKFLLEGSEEVLYTPVNNEKIIFEIYLSFLPVHVKTLLLQSNITSIEKANTFYIENNLIKDINLKNVSANNFRSIRRYQSNLQVNSENQNLENIQHFNPFRNNNNNFSNYNREPAANNTNFSLQNVGRNSAQNHRMFNNNNFRNYNREPAADYSNFGPQNVSRNSAQNYRMYNNRNQSGNFRNSGNYRNRDNDQPIPMDVDHIDIYQFSEYNSNNLPLINITVGNKKIKCLVDSGAVTTLGDFDTFNDFCGRKLEKKLILRTLTGSTEIKREAIVKLPPEFGVEKKFMSVKLVDFRNKPFKCILGINVLQPLGALIDFSRNALVINNIAVAFINCMPNDMYEPYEYNNQYIPEIYNIEKQIVDIDKIISEDLNEEEKKLIKNLLYKNKNLFYQDGQKLPETTCIRHQIITKPHSPIYSKNYKYPFALESEIENQIQDMLDNGIIRHSQSPYNAPLWIVKKKIDNSGKQKWRVVVDFRKLNDVTVDDKFPLPNIEMLFEKLGRAMYFSVIDLAKGFHQICMDENDICKTAFSTSKGHFEFVRMPFGLKNAPATFQRMVNTALNDHINKICIIYMDDILVFSTSLAEHMESLAKIFTCLNQYNLKIQYDKCKFLCKETTFLGHTVSANGIKPNIEKIKAIREVKLPKTTRQIKAFLGLTGYYRKFIQNYSLIAAPLIKYLKKNTKINITDTEYIESFNKLKNILTSPPLLAFPDMSKNFTVTTDASNVALGAVLTQNKKPICYASRTLNGHERRYHTLEKELLAIVWAIKYFRPYLFGKKFTVETDHAPLKWLFSLKDPNDRVLRWKTLLEEYNFDIQHVKGKQNIVADFLSRINNDESEKFNDDLEIKSLFENSIGTIHSAEEDLHEHFLIHETIVNKYRTQIRLVNDKTKEFEKMFNKYNIIYIDKNDLTNEFYLTDLFRRYLTKGTIGIYSELTEHEYNIIQNKLIKHFSNNNELRFIKCTQLAIDIESYNEILEIVEKCHIDGNHRGILENFEEIKSKYFFPNLKKIINKYINACRTCNENKYERKPFKKYFNHTETPTSPNEIVHIDVFEVHRTYFLTTIDRFSKLASVHRISDKNMCTIKVKLQERIAWLGKPKKMVMDNMFNNALIKMFCSENEIDTHFTTPHSHTGNADIERFHSTLLEHIRILKNNNNFDNNIEEIVVKATGFYNNAVHGTTKVKPIDFINKNNLNYNKIKDNMYRSKKRAIDKINSKRENVPNYNDKNVYKKNYLATRNKTAKRFVKYNKNCPNKVDIAQLKRPLKSIA